VSSGGPFAMDFLVELPSPEGDETDRQSLRRARPGFAG